MSRNGRGGFALVEVLIAILVLGLGVIGAAALQLTAMRTTQQSGFQTAALQLAVEMADKMRSNASQMRLADEHNPFLAIDFGAVNDQSVAPARLCHVERCTAEELARFDIQEWQQRVRAVLPGARAVVCRDARPWDESANAFSWACTPSTAASIVIKLGWSDRDARERSASAQTFPPLIALTVRPALL